MRFHVSRALAAFFTPRALVPFLLGSVVLSVLGNAVFQMAENLLGATTQSLVFIALGAVLILVGVVAVLAHVLAREAPPQSIPGKRPPAKHRGLILMVSQAAPCRKAIQYHQPALERCWLLCSIQTRDVAVELRSEFPKECCLEPIVIHDVLDPLEFRSRIQQIFGGLPDGWAEADVISDYLGMTAHASVGMVLACMSANRHLQYTVAHRNEQLRPIEPLDPIEITLE